ncbi:MAG: hypothetical protein WDM78_14610 [Puia sp.]
MGSQFRGQLLPQYDGAYDPTQTYTTTFADGSTYSGHVAPTPWLARGKDNLKQYIQTGLLSVNSVFSELLFRQNRYPVFSWKYLSAGHCS